MKLKHLLPVATIASVATIVTPLVSCKGNTNTSATDARMFLLEEPENSQNWGAGFYDLKKDVTYSAYATVFDGKDYDEKFTEDWNIMFVDFQYDEEGGSWFCDFPDINVTELKIDGKVIPEDKSSPETKYDIADGHWAWINEEHFNGTTTKKIQVPQNDEGTGIKGGDNISIHFTLNENFDNLEIYWNMSWASSIE